MYKQFTACLTTQIFALTTCWWRSNYCFLENTYCQIWINLFIKERNKHHNIHFICRWLIKFAQGGGKQEEDDAQECERFRATVQEQQQTNPQTQEGWWVGVIRWWFGRPQRSLNISVMPIYRSSNDCKNTRILIEQEVIKYLHNLFSFREQCCARWPLFRI